MVTQVLSQVPSFPTLAAVAIGIAGLTAAAVIAVPSRRIAASRRLHGVALGDRMLTRTADSTTRLIQRAVAKGGRAQRWSAALDRAGIRQTLPELLILVGCAVLVAMVAGAVLQGLLLAIALPVLVVLAAVGVVVVMSERRRRAFADQLDDLSQLMATNLRAGHSMLQSLSSLAVEIEEPARSELSRAVNQVRVGRDLGEALDETATRMASDDFTWVAQAIAIHRQVGGNLADVLDNVSTTIRERNQIRRQVHALSAEGRMSAVILMVLPVGVGGVLSLVNPIYFATFTQSVLGWVMLAICAVLMTLGGLWLRQITAVKY